MTIIIYYWGINFPTLVKHSDKLKAQKRNLAINIFGWENKCDCAQNEQKRIKDAMINLVLIEAGNSTLFLCRKSKWSALQSEQRLKYKALLHDLLDWFHKSRIVRGKNYCNGVNNMPMRIVMQEEGKNTFLSEIITKRWRHHTWYMRTLVRKIQQWFEHTKDQDISYTEKTEWHKV